VSDDFVTTLRLQLREAAEREARRSPLRRALPRPRPLVLAGAAAAAAAVALLIALGVASLGPPKPLPTAPAPHVVARLAVADKGGALSTGFGSLWTFDAVSGDVLRLNTDGTVVERIPTESGILDGWAGAGSMWALSGTRLYRIDPRTNRVVAKIELPPPSRWYGGVWAFKDSVWLVSSSDMRPVELAANRLGTKVPVVNAGAEAHGIASDASSFYVVRLDGRVLTLDARTGRRTATVPAPFKGLLYTADDGRLVWGTGSGVALSDAKTGKLLWRTNLGTRTVNAVAFGLGAMWVQGSPVSGRDQLWKLDPRTGEVRAALRMPDFGASGIAVTRDRLWIMSPTGVLTAIR
jgi:PQQ-like domain